MATGMIGPIQARERPQGLSTSSLAPPAMIRSQAAQPTKFSLVRVAMMSLYFGTSFGKDVITDFQASGVNQDVLQFSPNTFSSFAAVLAHAAQVGSDVVITADAADTVTLQNVHLSSLQKNDIHIV